MKKSHNLSSKLSLQKLQISPLKNMNRIHGGNLSSAVAQILEEEEGEGGEGGEIDTWPFTITGEL